MDGVKPPDQKLKKLFFSQRVDFSSHLCVRTEDAAAVALLGKTRVCVHCVPHGL